MSENNKIKGTLLISICTKNCQKWISYILKNIERYSSLFDDYYCLIVDGYSTDETEIISKNWCKIDSSKREFVLQPSSNLPRGESLKEARNFVLDKLGDKFGKDVYLLLLDADSPNVPEVNLEGFSKSFDQENKKVPDWTGLFCNQKNDRYYDILALRDNILTENYQRKYSTLNWYDGSMQSALKKYENTKSDPSGYYPVNSAFGGAGVYKTWRLGDARYECTTLYKNPADGKLYRVFECEHVTFNYHLIKNGYKLYINCDWYIGEHM